MRLERALRRLALPALAAALVAGLASPGRPATSTGGTSLEGILKYTNVTGDVAVLPYVMVAAVDEAGAAIATDYTASDGSYALGLGDHAGDVEKLVVASVTEHARIERCYENEDYVPSELAQEPFTFDVTPRGWDVEVAAAYGGAGVTVVGNDEAFAANYYEFAALWTAQRLERAWLAARAYIAGESATLPGETVAIVRYGCPGEDERAAYESERDVGEWWFQFRRSFGEAREPSEWYNANLDIWREAAEAGAGGTQPFIVVPSNALDFYALQNRSEYAILHEYGHLLNSLAGTGRSDGSDDHADDSCEAESVVWEEATADILAMALDWGDLAPTDEHGNRLPERRGHASAEDDLFLPDIIVSPRWRMGAAGDADEEMEWDFVELPPSLDPEGLFNRENHNNTARDDLWEADVAGTGSSVRVTGVHARGGMPLDRECGTGEVVEFATAAWVRDMMDADTAHSGVDVGAVVKEADLPVDAGYAPDGALLFDDWDRIVEPSTIVALLLDSSRLGDTDDRASFCTYLAGTGVDTDGMLELAFLNGLDAPCPAVATSE